MEGLDGSNILKAGFKEQKCFVQFDSQELATIIYKNKRVLQKNGIYVLPFIYLKKLVSVKIN